jgi:WD40 repeat protein
MSDPLTNTNLVQSRRVPTIQYALKYKAIIVVTDKLIIAYDSSNKKILWKNELPTNRVANYFQFQISHDNEYVACGNPLSEIKFFKVSSGKEAGSWQASGQQALAGAFTPDGKSYGLTTRTGEIKFWSLAEKKVLEDANIKLAGPSYIYQTNYSPNGKYLAYVGNTKFVIYDVEKKAEEKDIPPTGPAMRWFSFTSDNRYLVYLDNTALLHTWDMELKKEVKYTASDGQAMAFMTYGLNYPVFGDKNQLYYAMGPTLRGVDYITGEAINDNKASHAMHIGNAKISPNGRWIATVSFDSTIIWDREGNHIYTDRHTNANTYGLLSPLAWTPDGKYLIHPRDQSTIEFLDVEKLVGKKVEANKAAKHGAVVRELKYGPGPLYNIFISSDGKQLLGTGAYQTSVIARWNLEDKETLMPNTLPIGQNLNSNQVDISDDFRWIVMNSVADPYNQSGGRNAVQVLDLTTNAVIQRFDRDGQTPRPMNIVCMQFSGYDRLLTETRTTNIVIWDILSGKMALDIGRDGPTGNVGVSEISPDGRWLTWIETEDRGIRFYDVLNAKIVGRFMNNRTPASSIEMHITGDAPFVLTGGADTTALVWDLTEFIKDANQQTKSDQQLDKLWTDLISEDSLTAHRSQWKLIERGDDSIELFSKNVEPSKENPELPAIVKSLIAKMDSASFTDREEATRGARELGEIAEPLFSDALKETNSAEVRSRIRAIVADWKSRIETLTPKQQRNVRTILIAEKIGTPSAKAYLKTLTTGDPHARLTREATRTLERLEKQ